MTVDVQGKRVLIFGDSLSAGPSTLGGQLGKQIGSAGAAAVKVDAKVSRSAVNFWSGTNGEIGNTVMPALQAWSPDTVIVVLGTNDAASGVSSTADTAAFTRIRDSFPDADIWSVGPPTFARADLTTRAQTVYRTLQRVFGANHVIDLRPLTTTNERTADGVHFTAAGAQAAAMKLVNAMGLTNAQPSDEPSSAAYSSIALPWTLISILAAAVLIGGAAIVRRRHGVSHLVAR